jgi:tetratricopeptide (TPR) repeat protein
MANLFLSYSRKDEIKARHLTEWLEREGHSVWRDEEDIGGGASFSSEIEKALNDCDAVLALWSADSVQSAWVRDEAGYGRDAGKLIPFSLDGTEPPLGFRQFQSLSLSKWKGYREPPNADRIRQAIARVADLPQATLTPGSAPSRRGHRVLFGKPLLAGGVLALLAMAVLAFFLWQRWSSDRQIAIAVLPSPQSPDRAMAADYANVAAADMAAFLPRRFDRATVLAPDEALRGRSGYRMEISVDPRGKVANASLTLSDEGHTTLWSQNWSVADASAADLKAQVSASASMAALCLTDAKGGANRLSQPALGLYLSGCATISSSERSVADFEVIFDRVTKISPKFPPAWGYLALVRSWIAEGLRDGSQAPYLAAVERAREAIAAARKLDPKNSMTYDAEYHLTSNDTFQALKLLEKGAKIDPDNWFIQDDLSNELMSVGRMSDSVQAAQRGIELEPAAPYASSQYIQALVYSGQFSKAKAALAEAKGKWPNDPAIGFAEYGFLFRYGDPRAALELMPKVFDYSDARMVPHRMLLAAREDPSPSKIDTAIAALNAVESNSPTTKNKVLLALGNFGRVDQAYQLMDDPKFQPFIEPSDLFRPDFAAVRADPRFMNVAARLGLVRYWRESGYWPDFCTSEKLSYDCKAEAAKYPG